MTQKLLSVAAAMGAVIASGLPMSAQADGRQFQIPACPSHQY